MEQPSTAQPFSSGLARRAPGGVKPVIGLAGGIGSGKSLVARQFEQLGCAIIDADALAHQVLEQPTVRDTLVTWWGEKVLNAQGQVDRAAVGKCVFNAPADIQAVQDRTQLNRLEKLVHPRVHELREALRRTYEQQPQVKAIVEDCPLLFEAGIHKQCDVVVFVTTDRHVRLQRVKTNRGWSEAELNSREKNQLGLDIKAKQSDYVIDNSETATQTFQQVRDVFLKIIPENKQLSE